MSRRRADKILALTFVLVYCPFVYECGVKYMAKQHVDLPSFYYAAEAAFVRRASPYRPEAAGEAGRELNQTIFPYLYPPPSLLAFSPLALVTYETAKACVLVGSHLCLLLVLYLLLWKILRVRRGADEGGSFKSVALPPLLLLYVLLFHPIAVTLNHGQTNLFVLLLLCLTWYALKENSPPAVAALPLALAVLLKTYPLLLLAWLLIKRRYAVVLYTSGALLAATALGWFVLPREAWSDWFGFVLPSGGYGESPAGVISPSAPWNQSLNGFTARLFLDEEFALVPSRWAGRVVPYVLAALLVTTALVLARRLSKEQGDRFFDLEVGLLLLTMYLVAPLSWEHHLVFVLPAVLLALTRTIAEEGRTAAALVALAAFVLAWPIPFDAVGLRNPTFQLLISVKFYAVLALWGFFAWMLKTEVSRFELEGF